ncbi:MAG: Hsp20 family protein [Candidatus Nealsonbacteria bacterium]|nr:Hsp20 family protein [Candidatus Nealsonbacteria bacterium]
MALIPWRPLWDIDRFFDEDWIEPFGSSAFRKLPQVRAPRIDVYETDESVVAELEMPGAEPEDINVEVEEDVLRIEAETKKEEEKEEKGYYRKEISSASYKRTIPLPAKVVGEKAEAKYEDGILKVSVPKVEPEKKEKKSVKVKVQRKK